MTYFTIALTIESIGNGPPLLLLPDKGYGPWMWREQARVLSDHFRLFMPDFSDLHVAGNSVETLTVKHLADQLAVDLDQFGAVPVHVVGVGFGGLLAMELAKEHPEMIGKLVLCNTSCTDMEGGYTSDVLALLFKQGAEAAPSIQESITQLELYPHRDKGLIERVQDLKGDLPSKADYQRQLLAEAGYHPGDLGRIWADTLILQSADNKIIDPAEGRKLQAAIPGAVLKELDYTGHLVTLTDPGRVTHAIMGFILDQGTMEKTS